MDEFSQLREYLARFQGRGNYADVTQQELECHPFWSTWKDDHTAEGRAQRLLIGAEVKLAKQAIREATKS